MVKPAPLGGPAPSLSGPDANTRPRFSSPIMYSRWAGSSGFNFSGAGEGCESTT